MADNRDFKGIWIPKNIWLSTELTPLQKFFLAEIDSLDNDFGCTANNKYFADFFNCSESSASKSVNVLWKKGFITLEYNLNSSRIIRMKNRFEGGSKKVEGGSKKVEGGSKKVEHNNTFNNTSIKGTTKERIFDAGDFKRPDDEQDGDSHRTQTEIKQEEFKPFGVKSLHEVLGKPAPKQKKDLSDVKKIPPKGKYLDENHDFNKMGIDEICELYSKYNNGEHKASLIQFDCFTIDSFRDTMTVFIISSKADMKLTYSTIPNLASHFKNWCGSVGSEKIQQKIKGLKKNKSTSVEQIKQEADNKEILKNYRAEMREAWQSGKYSESDAIRRIREKEKELGLAQGNN